MTATLKEQLVELAELAPRVQATTDRVNALVARMEGVLVDDMAIGLEAETEAFEEKILASKARVVEHLCLGKLDDRAQIHVIERTWAKDGELTREERIPWSSCNRGTRLKAIAALPDLVANLVADARKLMDEANATANKVSGWISGEETTTSEIPASAPNPNSASYHRPSSSTSRRRSKK